MRPPRLTLFRSESNDYLFGYTFSPDGSNLPADLGPWRVFTGSLTPGIGLSEVRVIKQHGFYLREKIRNVVPLKKADQ
jgi:hypothetical protein